MTIETSKDAQAFSEFEHQGWQAVSGGYEQHFARLTSQSAPAVLDAAGVGEGMHVLDVCSGPGMLAQAALARGARVTGLDFSAEVVRIARRNVPDVEFREGDAQALPFPDDSFDAVVCGFGIIHVPDARRALREMHEVLKPGCRLAVSVWETPGPANGFGLLYGAVQTHADPDVALPHGPDFFQFSAEEKLKAALQETDFSRIAVGRVEQTWEFSNPSGLVASFVEGAVRARGLLLAQTGAVREAIEQAVIEGMQQFRNADGAYRVPMPALIGSGAKD